MSTEIVTELCEQGLAAENAGDPKQALLLYLRAWENADEPFDRSVAAHYRTRLVETDGERLTWAQASLESASRAADSGDERIYPLLPTLHVTSAAAQFEIGDRDAARVQYIAAARSLRLLGDSAPQAALLQSVVFEGLRATGCTIAGPKRDVDNLIARFQSDGALGPLAYVVSAYVVGAGTENHAEEFLSSLRELYDARVLAPDQQKLLKSAIASTQQSIIGTEAIEIDSPSDAVDEMNRSGGAATHPHDPFDDDGPNVALRI